MKPKCFSFSTSLCMGGGGGGGGGGVCVVLVIYNSLYITYEIFDNFHVGSDVL